MTKDKFSKIYEQHAKEIFSFFFLRTQSSDIAHDLSSEAFFKFWKATKDQPENYLKNPRAFLYRLSRNCLIDFYRKDGKENIVSIDTTIEDQEEQQCIEIQLKSDEDIMEEFSQDEKKQMVLKSIRMLKPIYADVLIYYYIQGLDSKEVAVIINKTEQNTRVIIHRALESLKKSISK